VLFSHLRLHPLGSEQAPRSRTAAARGAGPA